MDFYRHQDQARKLSIWILVLFILGLLFLSAALSLAGLFFWQLTEQTVHNLHADTMMWRWYVIGNATLFIVLLLIAFVKYMNLCRGGRVVAEMLGARYIPTTTAHPNERRLRNIVEEMGLAAGIPIPGIYILDEEPGINAFAAGMGLHDAVVVVTQGAMTYLTRDELQGVIAHEFSHIVHGDIRLNQQLAALIGSLVFIGEIGRWMASSSRSRHSYSSKNKGSGAIPIFGLLLMLLGVVGTLWGKIMKAALNRQREFLADASAVQFTRYSKPLADALKKVGGFRYSSLVFHPQAQTFGHLFFSQGLTENFRGWLATHPPLSERIQRLDPDWDGRYIANPLPVSEADKPAPFAFQTDHLSEEIRQHPELVGTVLASQIHIPRVNDQVEADTLQTPLHMTDSNDKVWVYDKTSTSEWLPLLPPPLLEAARSPFDARFVIYRLLISKEQKFAAKQRQLLGNDYLPVKKLMAYAIPEGLQFALIELAIPSLKEMIPAQFENFHQMMWQLIDADNQQSMEEWLTYRMVTHQLYPHFGMNTPSPIRLKRFIELQPAIEIFLSYLAFLDGEKAADSRFSIYVQHPSLKSCALKLQNKPEIAKLDEAMDLLLQSSMSLRCEVLQVITQAIESDGIIRREEAGLFQMMAYCLDCPLPPPNIWAH